MPSIDLNSRLQLSNHDSISFLRSLIHCKSIWIIRHRLLALPIQICLAELACLLIACLLASLVISALMEKNRNCCFYYTIWSRKAFIKISKIQLSSHSSAPLRSALHLVLLSPHFNLGQADQDLFKQTHTPQTPSTWQRDRTFLHILTERRRIRHEYAKNRHSAEIRQEPNQFAESAGRVGWGVWDGRRMYLWLYLSFYDLPILLSFDGCVLEEL